MGPVVVEQVVDLRCYSEQCCWLLQGQLLTAPGLSIHLSRHFFWGEICVVSLVIYNHNQSHGMIYDITRALSSQLHTPVPLAHHTYHKKIKRSFLHKIIPQFQKIIPRKYFFYQKYSRNYCSISSQIAYTLFLCFFVKMCFAKLHFLTVHLQTSHSISIWLYAFL